MAPDQSHLDPLDSILSGLCSVPLWQLYLWYNCGGHRGHRAVPHVGRHELDHDPQCHYHYCHQCLRLCLDLSHRKVCLASTGQLQLGHRYYSKVLLPLPPRPARSPHRHVRCPRSVPAPARIISVLTRKCSHTGTDTGGGLLSSAHNL